MFGPLRERIEAAVEKVEGMLVGFSFLFFDLALFCSWKRFLGFVHVDGKWLKVGFV